METSVMLFVNIAVLPCYSNEASLKQNDWILLWMKVGPIAFLVANSCNSSRIHVTCKILEAISY